MPQPNYSRLEPRHCFVTIISDSDATGETSERRSMSDWQEAEQRVEKAHELYEGGNWEAALKELRAAIEINPNNSSWYFNLGLTLDMMERYEEALKAYTQALRMDPHDTEVLHAAGVDATRLGRYKCSIDLFKRLERLDPTYQACY